MVKENTIISSPETYPRGVN